MGAYVREHRKVAGPSAGVKDLSILIVNWHSKDYLRKCLETLYRETKGLDFEVIVVDNASWDGVAEMIAMQFPQVKFIQSKENLGFARANNLAFQYSVGKAVLLLNPDTEILGNAIPAMLDALTNSPKAGIVGCKQLNSDLSIQTPSVKRFPSILQEVLGMEWLRKAWPSCKLWSIQSLFDEYQGPVQVDAVSGACQMISREVYQAVGGLNPDYFMYAEDVEISVAALAKGWETYHAGNAQIIHHGGRSSEKGGRGERWVAIMQSQALWHFYRTWRGLTYASLYRTAIGLVSVSRIIFVCIAWPVLAGCGENDTASKGWNRWTGKLLWAIGCTTNDPPSHSSCQSSEMKSASSKKSSSIE